jgi:phosphatidylinositol glycan class B
LKKKRIFPTTNIEQWIVAAALLWYVATAWYSSGWMHGDEHYQIIEFAAAKAGLVPVESLAWEYAAQIRPALQPALAWVVMEVCQLAGCSNPFTTVFFLRLFTALLAVTIIWLFARSVRHFIRPHQWPWFLFFSFFIWFLPMLNVRFSSETWSGLMLLAAAGFVVRPEITKWHYAAAGLLMGLAFLFRYQTAFASLGLLLWLLLINKTRLRQFIPLITAGMAIVLAGVALDSWWYQSLEFVPWNYFDVNILQATAASFGTAPWYYYFWYIFRYAFFPVGMLILISFIVLLIRGPKSLFVWIITPYLLIHILIPHKEVRFLFPLINFAAIVIFLSVDSIVLPVKAKVFRKMLFGFLLLIGLINVVALLPASFSPAGSGRGEAMKTINKIVKSEPADLYFTGNANPYDPWNGLPARFYLPSNIRFVNIDSISKPAAPATNRKVVLVVSKKDLDKPEVKEWISVLQLKRSEQSLPEVFVSFYKAYGDDTGEVLVVFY